jgi:glyoxylase-like metal-dependent hydrolase (beta-lactamase superfamily II)
MHQTSRRNIVLSAAGAFAAFGLTKPVTFIDAARAQQAPAPALRRFKVGDIEVISLSDGVFERQHDEAFITGVTVEQTKQTLRAAGLSDAHVPIPFTVLAVKSRDQIALIDSGTGGFPVYGPKAGILAQAMGTAGLEPKSITTIVISHFHADHINGLMTRETNAPTFPNAEIIVPTAELKWWSDQPAIDPETTPRQRRGLARRIQATLGSWKNVRQIDGAAEVFPGVRTIPAHGHTAGHTAHHISSAGKQLIVTADASLLPALFFKNPQWRVNFGPETWDLDPPLAEQSRRKLFDQAIADGAMVAGYHWGLPNVGTIAKDGNGYAFTSAA